MGRLLAPRHPSTKFHQCPSASLRPVKPQPDTELDCLVLFVLQTLEFVYSVSLASVLASLAESPLIFICGVDFEKLHRHLPAWHGYYSNLDAFWTQNSLKIQRRKKNHL